MSRLCDVCRHRLVFNNVRDLLFCVQTIILDKDITIRGVKNGLYVPDLCFPLPRAAFVFSLLKGSSFLAVHSRDADK